MGEFLDLQNFQFFQFFFLFFREFLGKEPFFCLVSFILTLKFFFEKKQDTPLHYLAQLQVSYNQTQAYEKIFKLMIEKKADVNAKDRNGDSLIDIACSKNPILSQLLENHQETTGYLLSSRLNFPSFFLPSFLPLPIPFILRFFSLPLCSHFSQRSIKIFLFSFFRIMTIFATGSPQLGGFIFESFFN